MNAFKSGRRHAALLYSLLVLLIVVAVCAIEALTRSVNIPTNHLDGAYQTASGLYRLAAGQLPGSDFYPYLGAGLVYFLYPVFQLAGSDVAAAVLASHYWALFGFFMCAATCFYLAAGKNNLSLSLGFALLLLVCALFFRPWLPDFFQLSLVPGNSLRPIRSLLPCLVAGSFALTLMLPVSTKVKSVVMAVVLGFCPLWSNDYALPTLLIFCLFGVVWLARSSEGFTIAGLVWPVAVFLCVSALIMVAATGGGSLELLRYNFVDVRENQFWYYGPWESSLRIFNVADVVAKLLPRIGLAIVLVPAVAILAVFRKQLELWLLLCVGLTTLLGGCLSTVGGHYAPGYFLAFKLWCLLTIIGLALPLVMRFASLVVGRAGLRSSTVLQGTALSLGVVLVGFSYAEYTTAKESASNDDSRFYVSELGGYLNVEWQPYIEFSRDFGGGAVFEEYWGVLSATANRTEGPKVDSVIHALGESKEGLLNWLDSRPQYVVTTHYGIKSKWPSWNLSANYWLYQRLFAEYRIISGSPTTLVWTKTDQREFSTISCQIVNSGSGLRLSGKLNRYYEVEVVISGSVETRALLMVENGINQAANAGGYVSLDTTKPVHTLPVYLDQDAEVFALKLVGNAPASPVTIQSCSAKLIPENVSEFLNDDFRVEI